MIGFVLVALLIALVLRSIGRAGDVAEGAGRDRARSAAGLGRLHVSCATPNWKRYQGHAL